MNRPRSARSKGTRGTKAPRLPEALARPSSLSKAQRQNACGQRMTGAEMIFQVLADEGVHTIFGYSGGAILPAYDALYRRNAARPPEEQIRLIVSANEQGAGFMAAGYARASGKVGVCLVTSGPGATNCVTPVRDSAADSVPLVVITGQVPRACIGTDAFQEAPVFSIMSACTKHVFLVEDEDALEATIRTAFSIARSGRPGPVVIDVPKDIQTYEGTFRGTGFLELKGYGKRLGELGDTRLSEDDCRGFFRLLGKSKRPLLYVGGGVISSGAAPALRAFMSRFNVPAVTTLMGIGSVDTTTPLCLHMLGMHGTAYANYAVEDCDFLIAVGARFDDRVAGNIPEFAPNARIAHIDIDAAEIGKVKGADWSHVGDARRALEALLEAGEGFTADFTPWVNDLMKLKKRHHLRYDEKSALIQPPYVVDMLNELTRGDAIVCTGVGQHQMYAAQYLDFHSPRTFITSGGMGTMGFGLPASIGAKLACPGKMVVDVDGDGSLRMNIGELETAVSYNVPVKIVLLNNRSDGMPRQWQNLYYGKRFSGTDKTARSKDFVKAAQADGFKFARRVTENGEVRRQLKALLAHDGPGLLEFVTDRDALVYPMVGPGQGYKSMVSGPFIAPREEGRPGK